MSTETAVRERPILFSGPMVRALLAGAKCQTRRVVTSPGSKYPGYNALADECLRCPYGAPGDRLWVKEGIRFVGATAMGDLSEYEADGALTKADGWPWQRPRLASIHCPRGLSRLTLEITDVRVQRVQEISEGDCEAEGIYPVPLDVRNALVKSGRLADEGRVVATSRDYFRTLWDSLNAARGSGWDANPWVWALTFRRVEVET